MYQFIFDAVDFNVIFERKRSQIFDNLFPDRFSIVLEIIMRDLSAVMIPQTLCLRMLYEAFRSFSSYGASALSIIYS